MVQEVARGRELPRELFAEAEQGALAAWAEKIERGISRRSQRGS